MYRARGDLFRTLTPVDRAFLRPFDGRAIGGKIREGEGREGEGREGEGR